MIRILVLLSLFLAAPAFAQDWEGACETVSVGTTSTQIFTAWGRYLNYVIVQNVSPVGGPDIYCTFGSNNTVTPPNGQLLLAHSGAWLPPGPIPNTDLACVANTGTAQVSACWW